MIAFACVFKSGFRVPHTGKVHKRSQRLPSRLISVAWEEESWVLMKAPQYSFLINYYIKRRKFLMIIITISLVFTLLLHLSLPLHVAEKVPPLHPRVPRLVLE